MDNFLVEMMAHIDQQYSDVEKECSILRKLLKPWPKKKRFDHENPPQIEAEIKSDECQKIDKELTPDEKIALEQVDRLIGKAHKALRIKEKVTVNEKLCATELNSNNLSGAKNEDDAISEDITSHPTKNPECPRNEVKTNFRRSDVLRREKACKEKKDISVTKKNLVVNRDASTPGNASHISSRGTTPRPLSATSQSRPSSSKSRHTPAHINAPFKTDVNTRVPHRKLNHIHKNHLGKHPHQKAGVVMAQKKPNLSNGLKKLPKITSNIKEKVTLDKDNDVFCGRNKEIEVERNDREIETPSEEVSKPVLKAAGVVERDVIVSNLNEQEECIEEPGFLGLKTEDPVSDVSQSNVAEQKDQFLLTNPSSKIKVPPKLGKLVAENCALLERCSTAKLVKKVPDTDVAQNFIDRLDAQNDISQELLARAKALSCLQSHHLMLKSLQSLGMENLTENAPFETVYRTKRLLEFILSIFAQTQEEADYFSRAQFRRQKFNGKSQTITLPKDDFVKSLFSNQGNKSQRPQKDRFVKDALDCTNAWTRLQFERDLIELQLHLLSLAEAEWSETLYSYPEHRILQMVHGLLTSSGEFFPAIVENPYSHDDQE